MTLTRIEEPVWPFMMFLYWFAAMLLLLVAGHQIIEGTLKLSVFVKFQFYLLFLQWPMLALGWTANLFQRGRTSWARIKTILEAEPAIKAGDVSSTFQVQSSRSDLASTSPWNLEPGTWNSHIAFRDVSLRLNDRTLLDHINLEIPPGQCLAITGPTGSGKTLLISLLVRLLDPTDGQVCLGGRDLRTLPLADLRRAVGLAPQEPFLFSDTLANNLALGLDPVDDALTTHEERIVRAAGIARLSDEVARFPDHYREPALLILDDVFSAVDTQTEAKILEQLLPALRGRTSILISHRVSTLRHADRILVLDHGRIVQDGTHAELIGQPGYYHELDEVQRLESKLEEVG